MIKLIKPSLGIHLKNKKAKADSFGFFGGDEGVRRHRVAVIAKRQPVGVSRQSLPCNEIARNHLVENKKAKADSFGFFGGDEGIRTPDLCIANASLYQLSHAPEFV